MISLYFARSAVSVVLSGLVSVLSVPCSRVPNRFYRIRDLAYFKAGIRDFEGKAGRDSELQL